MGRSVACPPGGCSGANFHATLMSLFRNAPFVVLLAGFTHAALAAAEESLDRRFPVQPGAELVVDVDFGAIEISTNAQPEVAISVQRKVRAGSEKKEKEFLADRPVVLEQDGPRIVVRSRRASRSPVSWNWGSLKLEGRYRITVPADCRINARTQGGHIHVTGIQAPVDARTSGGSLRFESVRGDLRGDTSGGSIRLKGCDGKIEVDTSGGAISVTGGSGSLDADTSGGSIQIVRFNGPIEAATSGGSINAVLVGPKLPGPVNLATSGGSVGVSAPDGTGFDLDAATSAGSVRSELPIESPGKPRRSELSGPVNGGGPRVRLRTSGGSISVRRSTDEPASLR